MAQLVGQHLPTRKLTKKQIRTMSKRDFFFRKFLNAKCPTTRTYYHNNFKRYRNLIVTLCRRKFNHYTEYFDFYSGNMQKIWQGVKQIISVKSSKTYFS